MFWNSRYDRFTELLMLDIAQKKSDSIISCICHVGYYWDLVLYLEMHMAARGRGRRRGHGRGANASISVEELMQTQNEMMHSFMQHLQHQSAPPPPPVHVRYKRGEFMKWWSLVFTHFAEPMKADDWLRVVERQLNIAQCNDLEKVLYACGQLR